MLDAQRKVICALPFCRRDADAMLDLLLWIQQLGGCMKHDALLVADAATPWTAVKEAMVLAGKSFKTVQFITNGESVEGWPQGPNSLWKAAAEWCFDKKMDWFWLEPDAFPLGPEWLDKIADEEGGPYRGAIITGDFRGHRQTYLNGVAVYPSNAFDYVNCTDDAVAFDLNIPLDHSKNSSLFHCIWGEKDNPPSFGDTNIPGTNVFCLRQINPEAVIFHRCKDGSLLRLLRRARGIKANDPFVVVLPFCNVDGPQACRNIQWIHELGGCPEYEAVLSYQQGTISQFVGTMDAYARASFKQVFITSYERPPITNWPHGPNFAFQHAARFMRALGKPWLWLESDCVPVRLGWIEGLQEEYRTCGKPVMGAVVLDCGHINGTAIYPANFCDLSPRAMQCKETAFDWAMKPDTEAITHNAAHLMCMVWGIENGKAMIRSGAAASFGNCEDVDRWVCPGAVLFHRAKDGTLIERLRERRKANIVPP